MKFRNCNFGGKASGAAYAMGLIFVNIYTDTFVNSEA